MTKYRLRDKKIYIYGAGDKGKRVLKVLNREGVSVEAFIDKRADAYSMYQGHKVLSPEDAGLAGNTDKDGCAIIVCIKNAFVHNDIAVKFNKLGFYNIIFMPLYVLKGGNDDQALNVIMEANSCLTDDRVYFEEEIPSTKNMDLYKLPLSTGIIEEGQEWLKAYVPAEFIYMPPRFKSSWTQNMEGLLSRHMLISYYAVRMYEEFDRCIPKEESVALNAYMQDAKNASLNNGMAVDEEWSDNFVESKRTVFHNMKNRMMLQPDFFAKSCAEVVWNGPYGFSITGTGKNRVSFLLSQGYKYLPVKMNKSDYKMWWNEKALEVLKIKLTEIGSGLRYPIPHPAFYEQPCGAENYLFTWGINVFRIIFDKYKYQKDVGILDDLKDYGYTSRILKMLGFEVCRKHKDELVGCIDQLFYTTVEENIIKNPGVLMLQTDNIEKFFKEWQSAAEKNIDSIFVQLYGGRKEIQKLMLFSRKYEIRILFTTCWSNEEVTGVFLGSTNKNK